MNLREKKGIKFLFCILVIISLCIAFFGVLPVSAAQEMRVVFTDVTNTDTATLQGEMKVKVSIEGYSGRADTLQMYLDFSGDVKYKSIEYFLDNEPYYVPQEPIKVNENKKLQLAAIGVGAGPSGSNSVLNFSGNDDFCVLTFEGTGDLTLTLDSSNSYIFYNNEETHPENTANITVSPGQSDNVGVNAEIKIVFDEMAYAQNPNDSKITLTLTHRKSGISYYSVLDQRSLAEGGNLDTSTSTPTCVITQKILAGSYDLVLDGYGYTRVEKENLNFMADQVITIEPKEFRAGDIDDDGKITLADYNFFMSVYQENYTAITANSEMLYFYDFNRDGKLDIFDLEILKNSVERGIESL